VGMFDRVRCLYPLPHHQDAEFQTKDILSLLEPHAFSGGALDDYEIMKSGRLRVRRHKRKWVKAPGSFLGAYFKSIKSWWEYVPTIHGDMHIYTSEGEFGKRGYRWIEFRVRFTNGRVQEVREVKRKPIRKPVRRVAHA